MNASANTLFDTWITERRIEGGASAIGLNQDGMAALQIDNGIVINFLEQPADRRLVLYAILGALPAQSEPAIMRDMLQANLLWAGTGGATMSLQRDPGSGVSDMVLAVAVDLLPGTGVGELDRAFDLMCSAALGWKARLDADANGQAGSNFPAQFMVLPDLKP